MFRNEDIKDRYEDALRKEFKVRYREGRSSMDDEVASVLFELDPTLTRRLRRSFHIDAFEKMADRAEVALVPDDPSCLSAIETAHLNVKLSLDNLIDKVGREAFEAYLDAIRDNVIDDDDDEPDGYYIDWDAAQAVLGIES